MESLSKLQIYANSRNGVKEKFVPDLLLYLYYFKRRPFFIIDLNRASIIFRNDKDKLSLYLSRQGDKFIYPIDHKFRAPWVSYKMTGQYVVFHRNLAMLKYIFDHCYIEIIKEFSKTSEAQS